MYDVYCVQRVESAHWHIRRVVQQTCLITAHLLRLYLVLDVQVRLGCRQRLHHGGVALAAGLHDGRPASLSPSRSE
jgi:hypothetical protein